MNLLAPPKNEVWPDPPQPGQGGRFGLELLLAVIVACLKLFSMLVLKV
jgi:hypothetical protein